VNIAFGLIFREPAEVMASCSIQDSSHGNQIRAETFARKIDPGEQIERRFLREGAPRQTDLCKIA